MKDSYKETQVHFTKESAILGYANSTYCIAKGSGDSYAIFDSEIAKKKNTYCLIMDDMSLNEVEDFFAKLHKNKEQIN